MEDKEKLQALLAKFALTQKQFDDVKNISITLDEESLNSIELNVLLGFLQVANSLYRSGYPCVDDSFYDLVRYKLSQIDPNNQFLNRVESEDLIQSKTVTLPTKMLSTDKAYSIDDIDKWFLRIKKAASNKNLDFSKLDFRVTPKLDGYAAYDDGKLFYTRGDGNKGQDISRVFEMGLSIGGDGKRGQGPGEIVINKQYFMDNLADFFENSRNIQAAILAEKNVSPMVQKAVDVGAAVFFPFSQLPSWHGDVATLQSDFSKIIDQIWNSTVYDVDGVVIECTNDLIKEEMGSTLHHHRWQIAFKVNEQSAEVRVLNVIPQTSRTGRVTPVVELEPTRLSGALISRATAHHYQMVIDKGIGVGALIRLVRSGQVIPKIEDVIEVAVPKIPTHCPSCNSILEFDGDNLVCLNNSSCPAQSENTMLHFFQTLGNVDGFGPATISIFYQYGISKVSEIYQLDENSLIAMGYKEKTIQNVLLQLQASRKLEIEDWRFLSAFGILRLGKGSCERLLKYYKLPQIFDLTVENLCEIDGFASKSAKIIVDGLALIKKEFDKLYSLGFNLVSTYETKNGNSPISNKTVVFTGTMEHGSREDMEKQAKLLGAKVAKAVTKNTSYLIIGQKVGQTKTEAATELGITILTELQYLEMLKGS